MTAHPDGLKFGLSLWRSIPLGAISLLLVIGFTPPRATAEDNPEPITVEVNAGRVANRESPTSYTAPVSHFAFDPQIDLQSRNRAEAQGDIAIRGGTFEDSAVQVGAVTIIDPQTGHYTAEIPFDPRMLSTPEVKTGTYLGQATINGTAGAVVYGLARPEPGFEGRIGGGDHRFNYQEAYGARELITSGARTLAIDLSAAHTGGDGTLPEGDHAFRRFAGRAQLRTPTSQTDLMTGYQAKFFAWPYLYAVRPLHELVGSSGIESEDLATSLTVLNHHMKRGDGGETTFTAFYRQNLDDYEFDRAVPGRFNPYRHRTRSGGAGAQGRESVSEELHLSYSGQLLFDDIESSALTFGPFASRSYRHLALAPEWRPHFARDDELRLFGGIAWDDTNRESSAWLPSGGVAIALGPLVRELRLEYSRASRVPGYTALKSNPQGGLFRGDDSLQRQVAESFELRALMALLGGEVRSTVFHRRDFDLVDWTYSAAAPAFTSRSARNVDIATWGVEEIATWRGGMFDVTASYAFLFKNDDYTDDSDFDASFYALNFPKHRATFALVCRLADALRLRIDNEYRVQQPNSLRTSTRRPFFTAASIEWEPPTLRSWSGYPLVLILAVDNAWNERYEEVPGVPGYRRLFSGGIMARW